MEYCLILIPIIIGVLAIGCLLIIDWLGFRAAMKDIDEQIKKIDDGK